MGHYCLDKNKDPEHMKFAFEMALRYGEDNLGSVWTPEMKTALLKLVNTTFAEAARVTCIFLDSMYKTA